MSVLNHTPKVDLPHASERDLRALLAEAEAALEHDPACALELALSVHQRAQSADVKARAQLLIGRAEYQRGNLLEASVALGEARFADDSERSLGRSLTLSRVHHNLSQFEQAAEQCDLALSAAQQLGDLGAEVEVLNVQAGVFSALGEDARALEALRRALRGAQHLGLEQRQANILNNMGNIYTEMGDYPHALESLKWAYDLFQKTPAVRASISNLINLGYLYQNMGKKEDARRFFQRAKEVSRAADDALLEAAALNNLANTFRDDGACMAARDLFEEALHIVRQLGVKGYEIDNLDGLGQVQAALGNYEQALGAHTAALSIARDIGDREGEVDALLNLGRDYLELNQQEDARHVLTEGLTLARELERLKSVYEAHELLSQAYEAAGDLAQALSHQREFHRAEKTIFNRENEAKTRQLTVQFALERARFEAEEYRLRTEVAQEARREAEAAVAERTVELEEAQLEVVTRLALAAEYRDDVTGEHTRRVGRNAAAIAYALGWLEDEVKLLYTAARLHDVGKIGVSDAVLLKPDKLTEDEYELIRQHTVIGARILSDGRSRLLQMAEEIALAHHERFDGRGYPHALAGERIPETARIVAVADVLDALTHERPYKRAWSVEETLAEIARGSGEHFDPQVVAVCLRIFGEGKLSPLEPQTLADTLQSLREVLDRSP